MSWDNIKISDIVDETLESVVKNAVKSVIVGHAGCAIDTEIKDIIKSKAKEIVEKDPEIQAKIRERLLYWISEDGGYSK